MISTVEVNGESYVLESQANVALAEAHSREDKLREALEFILTCGDESVDWCGPNTKESVLSICREALL